MMLGRRAELSAAPSSPREIDMFRHLTLLCCTLILVAGCSNNPERALSSPTSTSGPEPGSLLGTSSVAPGGVSGKFDVSFPGRNDSFDFRNQLETKYRTSLGRGPAPTFVDAEGEVVWTQEYMRYRVNGCDHATATQRVMSQINGQPAGEVCGPPQDGLITFPPRTDSYDFRRQLEVRYQQFNRGAAQSAVDPEGGVVWTQEYLRYRVNACDHPTSIQKVFSQIDGGPVPATCYVPPCIFTTTPRVQSIPATGGTFTATVTRTSGDCAYNAESLNDFISITGGITSPDPTATNATLTYTVAPNPGGPRSGLIRVRWTNNSTLLEINQDANNVSFSMSDPLAGGGGTTTCAIRTTSTPCSFTVNGSVSEGATYTWNVSYVYGGTITHTQSSTNPNFSFTQTCGGPGATASGLETGLNVTLTITDANGTFTLATGSGGQPPLIIKFFTC